MHIVIVGMGESGVGAKLLAESFGYSVTCIDANRTKGYPEHSYIQHVDLYVISPGISLSHPQIRHAVERNIPWIGEAEFALLHAPHTVVGITGTNGKTTTTELLEYMLVENGLAACACGNNGYALSRAVCEQQSETILVAELSSAQLETMWTPKLSYAAWLNIAPDHLDRYGSFDSYVAAKGRLKHICTGPIFCPEDPVIHTALAGAECITVCSNEEVALRIAAAFGVDGTDALESFAKRPHRLQHVATIDEVLFVNDSKATNVAATLYALSHYSRGVHLLLGGKGKGESFTPLARYTPDVLETVYAFGEASEQIEEELSPHVSVERVLTLEDGIEKAYARAKSEDVVLLSPACASFDQFENYERRGEMFCECVHKMSTSLVQDHV